MTTRFGFDDAGVGFDQAPFASIYADIEVQAGKTMPAFSASVTLSKDRRLHVEVTAAATFPAFSGTATVQSRMAVRNELTADKTFPSFTATATVQTRVPIRHTVQATLSLPAFTATATVQKRTVARVELTANRTFPAITATADVLTRTPDRNEIQATSTFPAFTATATVAQRIPDILPVAPAIDDMGGFAGIDVGTITLPVATGGNTPLTYSVSGLPAGLTFTASNREVTGTPTATGAFNVTYAVEDADGDTDGSGFVWRVADYDDTGKTVSARMYVVAGDAELYRDGQHGTLLPESDAAIDDVGITINRIRYQTAQGLLFLNRSGSDSFQTEFENTGGEYNTGDWQIVLETATDSITWDIPADVNAGTGAGNLRLELTAAEETILAGIEEFHPFILALVKASRVEIEAAASFPAFTSTANVQTRSVNRHEIQASQTFGAFTGTAAVQTRTADRIEIQANKTFPAFSATVGVGAESPLEGSKTFPAFSGTTTVQTRFVTRHELTAVATFPALTTSATINQRALLVQAAKIFPAFTATATVQTRMPIRHEIRASKTFPAMTATVAVNTRMTARRTITAAATFDALTATAMVQTRQPTRRTVEASKTFAAFTGSASVQVRAPTRRAVEAAKTFPAMTSTATVLHHEQLTAAATFPAFAATVNVQTRQPARNELTADKTFPAFTAALSLSKLERRLTLADFTRTVEYNLDALALITRASTGNVLWNADGSRFGGTDVLDAGELGLSPDNAPITRIRNPSANRLQFQDDNTAFSLSDYFIVDEGQDALITLQTIDGAVSFEVNGNVAASPTPNARRITFETPAALDTLLASLAVTDSLLIAIELPVPRHNLTLGETFPIFTATVNVHTRAPARKEVQAAKTFPALAATAAVLETEELTAAATFPAFTATATVQTRVPLRKEIQASKTFPAMTAAANVLGIQELTASATFPSFTATLTLDQRNPPRQIVTADKTFGFLHRHGNCAITQADHRRVYHSPHSRQRLTVQQRMADRIELTAAAKTFPAFSVAADVYQTERVEAD